MKWRPRSSTCALARSSESAAGQHEALLDGRAGAGHPSRAIQDSIQGSFPPALLLTLAGYAIVFGLLAARCFRRE